MGNGSPSPVTFAQPPQKKFYLKISYTCSEKNDFSCSKKNFLSLPKEFLILAERKQIF